MTSALAITALLRVTQRRADVARDSLGVFVLVAKLPSNSVQVTAEDTAFARRARHRISQRGGGDADGGDVDGGDVDGGDGDGGDGARPLHPACPADWGYLDSTMPMKPGSTQNLLLRLHHDLAERLHTVA